MGLIDLLKAQAFYIYKPKNIIINNKAKNFMFAAL